MKEDIKRKSRDTDNLTIQGLKSQIFANLSPPRSRGEDLSNLSWGSYPKKRWNISGPFTCACGSSTVINLMELQATRRMKDCSSSSDLSPKNYYSNKRPIVQAPPKTPSRKHSNSIPPWLDPLLMDPTGIVVGTSSDSQTLWRCSGSAYTSSVLLSCP